MSTCYVPTSLYRTTHTTSPCSASRKQSASVRKNSVNRSDSESSCSSLDGQDDVTDKQPPSASTDAKQSVEAGSVRSQPPSPARPPVRSASALNMSVPDNGQPQPARARSAPPSAPSSRSTSPLQSQHALAAHSPSQPQLNLLLPPPVLPLSGGSAGGPDSHPDSHNRHGTAGSPAADTTSSMSSNQGAGHNGQDRPPSPQKQGSSTPSKSAASTSASARMKLLNLRLARSKRLSPLYEGEDSTSHKMEGWLVKQGFYWRKKWVHRYIVLKPGLLQYFENDKAALKEKPLGELVLTAATVVEMRHGPPRGSTQEGAPQPGWFFTLLPEQGPVWELAADSESSRAVWMEALRQSSTWSAGAQTPVPEACDTVLVPESGQVPEVYDMGKELDKGLLGSYAMSFWSPQGSYRIIEGVHRETCKNYALKIVPKQGVENISTPQLHTNFQSKEWMHLHDCVDEVYEHPKYFCIVMRWGKHLEDRSNQLTLWIIGALRLLREVLPEASSPRFLRLSAKQLQRFLQRLTFLEVYMPDTVV